GPFCRWQSVRGPLEQSGGCCLGFEGVQHFLGCAAESPPTSDAATSHELASLLQPEGSESGKLFLGLLPLALLLSSRSSHFRSSGKASWRSAASRSRSSASACRSAPCSAS